MVLLSLGAAAATGGAFYYYTKQQQPTPSSIKGDIDDIKDGTKKRTVVNYNASKPVRQYCHGATKGAKWQNDYYGTSEAVAEAPTPDIPKELPSGGFPEEFENYLNKKLATDKRYSKMMKIKGGDDFMQAIWTEWRSKKLASLRPSHVADTVNAAQAARATREASKLFSGENFHTYCLEAQKPPLRVTKHRGQKRFSPYFNPFDDGAYVTQHNSTGHGFGAVTTSGGISGHYHLKSSASSYGTKADVAPPARADKQGNTIITPGGYAKVKPRNMRGIMF